MDFVQRLGTNCPWGHPHKLKFERKEVRHGGIRAVKSLLEAVNSALVGLQDLGKAVFVVMKDQLALTQVIACGNAQVLRFAGEGTQHQQLFALGLAGVAVKGVAQGEMLLVHTVAHGFQTLAQRDGLFVEVQNGIGILFLLGNPAKCNL